MSDPYSKTTFADGDKLYASSLNKMETQIAANDSRLTTIEGKPAYSLPIAKASELGGIKVGNGLSITNDGVLSSSNTQYTLPTASSSTLGGIKIGSGLTMADDGVLSANSTQYTLPAATTSSLGGIKVGSGLSVAADGTLSSSGGGGSSTAAYDPLILGINAFLDDEDNETYHWGFCTTDGVITEIDFSEIQLKITQWLAINNTASTETEGLKEFVSNSTNPAIIIYLMGRDFSYDCYVNKIRYSVTIDKSGTPAILCNECDFIIDWADYYADNYYHLEEEEINNIRIGNFEYINGNIFVSFDNSKEFIDINTNYNWDQILYQNSSGIYSPTSVSHYSDNDGYVKMLLQTDQQHLHDIIAYFYGSNDLLNFNKQYQLDYYDARCIGHDETSDAYIFFAANVPEDEEGHLVNIILKVLPDDDDGSANVEVETQYISSSNIYSLDFSEYNTFSLLWSKILSLVDSASDLSKMTVELYGIPGVNLYSPFKLSNIGQGEIAFSNSEVQWDGSIKFYSWIISTTYPDGQFYTYTMSMTAI